MYDSHKDHGNDMTYENEGSRDMSPMVQISIKEYDVSVKKIVTIVACENGETQVKVLPPKKEYFITLMGYISEYQERYGQKTIT